MVDGIGEIDMRPFHILHLLNDFADSSISRIVQNILANLGTGDFAWHVGALSKAGDMHQVFLDCKATVADRYTKAV